MAMADIALAGALEVARHQPEAAVSAGDQGREGM
jgi:hypothetical protein